MNYVFVNGYMIAGPTRALIEQALRYHDSGVDAEEFGEIHRGPAGRRQRELLGVCLSQPGAAGAAFCQGRRELAFRPAARRLAMAATMEPTLLYAYAYGDHIEVAANTEGGPFGLSPATLLGMPNAFELHRVLEKGTGK